ncbi:MFS transporter [Actinoplanes aureus]|uniref:MFS transporter n=1 Tax=Actinoplanes aureus TaxID=2792083 RepID=A0A931CEI0_9ACTN|nr:MFS transporter [Actinoplanes aureus]MBG0563440.1 MFS transporter [Actinoplanes aureus]
MRRNSALFVLISLFSGFGGNAMTLAAGVWIVDLTGSAALAALAGLGIYAPSLAAPWLGALVDRFPRRPLLIATDLLVGAALCSLLTVHSTGQVALIYAVLLVRGIGYVLLDAGETALLPAALPRDALGTVNGWRSSAQEGMKLLAPLAGAALYAWRGPVPVVLLCAVLPLVTALLYALVALRPAATAPPAEHEPAGLGWQSVKAGVRTLWDGPMRVPVAVAAVAIGVSGVTNAAVLSRVVDGLQLPATHLGILASVQGAGSIVGGVLVGRLLSRIEATRVASLGAVLFAFACAAWCLPWWPALIAGSLLAGLGLPWTLIAALTAIQTGTPDHLLGRVAATGNMVMFGPIALTLPLGSALVLLGSRVPLLLGMVVVLATGLLAITRRPVPADRLTVTTERADRRRRR